MRKVRPVNTNEVKVSKFLPSVAQFWSLVFILITSFPALGEDAILFKSAQGQYDIPKMCALSANTRHVANRKPLKSKALGFPRAFFIYAK